jgi:hypothetical protein
MAGSLPNPKQGGGATGGATSAGEEGWGAALVESAIILVLAMVGFGVVPDRLISYLSLHMSPAGRDLLVSLWILVFFVFLCWLYVRLQRPRATR